MRMTPFRMAFAVALLAATPFVVSPFVAAQAAQTPNVYSDMHWREIGPTRAGRARALAGVPSEPNVFYVGFDNGGVWRSTDYGSTWVPLFDKEPAGSIGAIAVAPSDPNVIYVGSGAGIIRPDLSTGDGMYKSTDAGKTWTHLGLRDSQMIADIAVDPKNPDRLFVAVLGHPYGPNEERGIFRSTDGGETFQKVLYRDDVHVGQQRGPGSVEPAGRLRHALAAAAGVSRGSRVRRLGWRQRHLQVDRRRHHLEAADGRTAERDRGEPGDRARAMRT